MYCLNRLMMYVLVGISHCDGRWLVECISLQYTITVQLTVVESVTDLPTLLVSVTSSVSPPLLSVSWTVSHSGPQAPH